MMRSFFEHGLHGFDKRNSIMNFEASDGARLISLLNIRVICEIRVRLLSPRKRIIDSWCLVLPL